MMIAPTVDRSASGTAAVHTFHKLHSLPFEIPKGEGPGLRVAELKELESDILNTSKFCRELLKGSNEVQASGVKLEVQLPYQVFKNSGGFQKFQVFSCPGLWLAPGAVLAENVVHRIWNTTWRGIEESAYRPWNYHNPSYDSTAQSVLKLVKCTVWHLKEKPDMVHTSSIIPHG